MLSCPADGSGLLPSHTLLPMGAAGLPPLPGHSAAGGGKGKRGKAAAAAAAAAPAAAAGASDDEGLMQLLNAAEELHRCVCVGR